MHCLCTSIYALFAIYHVHLRRSCPWELGSGFHDADHDFLFDDCVYAFFAFIVYGDLK